MASYGQAKSKADANMEGDTLVRQAKDSGHARNRARIGQVEIPGQSGGDQPLGRSMRSHIGRSFKAAM
jgi:hypothetical protein